MNYLQIKKKLKFCKVLENKSSKFSLQQTYFLAVLILER